MTTNWVLTRAAFCVQLGLKVLRGAVWAAALTMTAVKTRHACYNTADAVIHAMVQLKRRGRSSKQSPALQGSTSLAEDSDSFKTTLDNALCHVDVAAGGAGMPGTPAATTP